MAAKRSISGPSGRSRRGAAQQRHQSHSSSTVRPPSAKGRKSDQAASRASPLDVEEKADASAKTVAPTADALEEIIENERVHLMQVHAMLKCLYEVLLYADDGGDCDNPIRQFPSGYGLTLANLQFRRERDRRCVTERSAQRSAVLYRPHLHAWSVAMTRLGRSF
jgi:hypothetical protein